MIQAHEPCLTDFRLPELEELLEVDNIFADENPDKLLDSFLAGASFEAPSSDLGGSKSPINSPSWAPAHVSQDLDLSSLDSSNFGLRDVYPWPEVPSSTSEQSAVHEDIAGKTHAEAWLSTASRQSHK